MATVQQGDKICECFECGEPVYVEIKDDAAYLPPFCIKCGYEFTWKVQKSDQPTVE